MAWTKTITMIEPVETQPEEQEANKPLLNVQLPAPLSGDPNAPLSVERHNAAAQHNFQEVANVLLTIINNQKMMSMAIGHIDKQEKELELTIQKMSANIMELLKDYKKEDEDNKPKPDDTTK